MNKITNEQNNKETTMKQWSELRFVITKDDDSSLEIGTDEYPIKKDNTLFNSLLTFEASYDEREIEIECYINHADDINVFNSFFELSDSSQTYKMATYFNGNKYNSTVVVSDKPIEVKAIEDLYGTDTQPTAAVKISLIMKSPFFYSDNAFEHEISSGTFGYIQYPLSHRLNDDNLFTIGYAQGFVPYIVDNTGNENNGLIITIQAPEPIVNPIIYNKTTGLSTSFNMYIDRGSTAEINTIEKSVYLDGVYQGNVKNLFDKWLELIEGKNVIQFDSESGAENAKVQVKFYNKYRALK